MWKKLFFALLIRPIILMVTGVNVQGRENFPKEGPCIIVANHNSHLDTMVLMSLFSSEVLSLVRPVAAADYFLKNKMLAWFSQNVIDIIPISRKIKANGKHPFSELYTSLEKGDIVILFPEGSRGNPEEMVPFKTGVAHVVKRYPLVSVVPVYIHGAGKSLPKGEALFVPFIIDVRIGKTVDYKDDDCKSFTDRLENTIQALGRESM